MYKLLQRHGKKIMAVASAGLMIAFIIPSATKYGANHDVVIGQIGGEQLHNSELFNARQSWELLNRVPLDERRSLAMALGPAAVSQITRHPVLFLLLQKEAQRMGVIVTNDQIQSNLVNTPGLVSPDPERNDNMKRALNDLLLVREAFRRASSAIKISQPLVEHELAQSSQSLMLNLAEFNVAKYTDKVPAPTPEQLKAQFEKYADVQAGPGDEGNPFGFGYKYPDRAKLQYIVVPRAEVRKVVEASRTPYQWEVDSRIYYKQHQNLFPTTQPTPTNQPFSFESTSRPTTRPFDEIRQDVKEKLIADETTKRITAIQDRIVSTLAGDWVAYRNAAGTATQPTTVPATSVGPPYNSVEYLKKVAERIQANKEFGVLPTVVSLADKWLTGDEMSAVPGLGQASFNGVPITRYLMALSAPFVAPEQRKENGVLQVLQPTQPVTDSNESVYIARVTAADPAHKPASIAEVEPVLRADVIKQQAYALAKADAEKLLAQAREKGLKEAAGGLGVVTAGPITSQSGEIIPGFPVSGTSAAKFTEQAFKLVSTPTSRPSGKPLKLIELAKDGRLVVAELGDLQAMWNERSRAMQEAQLHAVMGNELTQRFSRDWFDYDSVARRLSYVPNAAVHDQEAPTPPPQPVAPIF